jgi:hypothetical protein
MPKKLTPDVAVLWGTIVVNGAVLAFFVTPAIILNVLPERYLPPSEPQIAIPLVLGIFAGAWLTWSVLAPRWRLWAYRRVEDIDMLKALAVEQKLLWPEGHFFQRTEIASRALREELARIEREKAHRGQSQ